MDHHDEIQNHQEELRKHEEQIKLRENREIDKLIQQEVAEIDRHEEVVEFLENIMDTPEDEERFRITSFLSGLLYNEVDDLFFHTVFARKQGKCTPIVLLSNGKVEVVRNNARILMEKEIGEDGKPVYKKIKDVPREERYQFFKHKNIRYKYTQPVFFDETHGINTVDNEAIQNIVKDKIYTKEIYDEVNKTVKKYYFHPSRYEYDVLCTASIVTYIIHLLGNVFYLVFLGGMGAGKSTGLTLLSFLQFNGRFGGKGSVPSSVRLIHQFSIALNQDEFEKMSKEEKNLLVNVFNTGFNRYGKYTITNMGVKDITKQVIGFNTYGMKSFTCNSFTGFDPSFIDRCHVILQVKTSKKLKNIFNLTDKELKHFQNIRNKLFVYCLKNWKELLKDIKEMKNLLEGEGVFGRETDKNSIILGIIRHFKGSEYALDVKLYLEEKAPVLQMEHAQTMEFVILDAIADMINVDTSAFVEVLNETLYEALLNRFDLSPNDKYAPSDQKPRKILDSLGLTQKKENLGYSQGGKRKYIINVAEFVSVLQSHGHDKILEKVSRFQLLNPPKPLKPSTDEIEGSEEVEDENTERFLLNEKITDSIQIIKQHPDDNYELILEKYGQPFIDECLERNIFFEELLGKKLVFIGGK